MANTQTPCHPDHSSHITYIRHPQPNNNFVPQPSFNTNYMQQPTQNLKDISDPTTAFDMALEFMSKAFQLNNTTPTNNNQRSLSNPCYNQIEQSGHLVVQNATQNSGIQIVENMNGLSVVLEITNQYGNRNVVTTSIIEIANQLRSGKAPVYDTARSDEAHLSKNGYDNDIFNMFTQEEQYTELLDPILELHQVPQNDSNVISKVSSVKQGGGIVEKHPANVEETRALYDSLYNNLAIKVEKVNMVNLKLRETNAELTTKLARYKNQEKCFEISQEKYNKLERCYQKSVYQEQGLTKKINALHLSFGKQITTLNEEISNLNNQLSKEKSTVSSLIEEEKRLKSDFKIHKDELLDKQIQLEK
nr:hypothetical protein [Tanacetum cinerariifolium]